MGNNDKPSKYFDPSTCAYKLSGAIRRQIDDSIESDDVSEDTKSILKDISDKEESNKSTLSYDMIVKLHKYLQRADRDYTEPFYMFAEKCKCIEPKPRENKALEERLKRLRFECSKAFYNTMASSVDKSMEDRIEQESDSSLNIYSKTSNNQNTSHQRTTTTHYASEFKKLNGSVMAVFNSFLVFICTFIFCYKALEYSLARPNIIAQVVFGLAGSTVVAFAELYFLIRVI